MNYQQTPSQTVGPFFSYGLLAREGMNILVEDQTRGQRITIRGRVIDGDGLPVPDALLEIWQADASGFFNHPADPNAERADHHFRGFGRAGTGKDGEYGFQTIKPGVVPYDADTDQAPHINVRVFARGMLIHAYTRLYFADEAAANRADPVLNLVPLERRPTLLAVPQGEATYCFDILLQGPGETVFFNP